MMTITNDELIRLINECGHALCGAEHIDATEVRDVKITQLNEDAELITALATFKEDEDGYEPYIAMIYYPKDEMAFMPDDWQGHWEIEPLLPEEINEPTWIDQEGMPAIMFDGLPRKLFDKI